MRSPAEMDIIQIDVSNRCFLNCSNCTRLIAHQGKKWEIDGRRFLRAIQSLQDWYEPGKIVGMIAGEPTLNTNFEELCHLFANNFGGPRTTHGRMPIRDFNAFAMERLFDRSNGRGLWTSLGPGFHKHYEAIMDTFSLWTTNDHRAGGRHQALLIHRDDYRAQTGMSQEEWENNRDNCWVQRMWSATINDKGAYFCEVAGAIDRLLHDGKSAWPVETRWWMRQPADFKDQLHLCDHCALAQPGPSCIDAHETDVISPKNLVQLGMSPAVKKNRYVAAETALALESRKVETIDSYIAGPRVSADNDSVRPKSITAIVTCVGRAEHLKLTLPHNAKLVDRIIVATGLVGADADMDDFDYGPSLTHCPIMIVNAEHRLGDAAFNKGVLLNAAFSRAFFENPDWILLTDADCLLNPRLPEFIKSHALNPGVLYGTRRQRFHGDLSQISLWDPGHDSPAAGVDNEPNGFFQLFHPRAQAIRHRWPALMSEAFCSAGGIDSWFMSQWPREKRRLIPELAVVHIEHGDYGASWNGPRREGCWRQAGIVNHKGEYMVIDGEKCEPGERLRFTSTLDATQTEGHAPDDGRDFPNVILEVVNGDLRFLGKSTQGCHVHVAHFKG